MQTRADAAGPARGRCFCRGYLESEAVVPVGIFLNPSLGMVIAVNAADRGLAELGLETSNPVRLRRIAARL